MSKFIIATFIVILSGLTFVVFTSFLKGNPSNFIAKLNSDGTNFQNMDEGGLTEDLNPLSIELLRKGEYPGSEIVIEQTLDPGSNYSRHISSYKSEGLKIFALLTIPKKHPYAASCVVVSMAPVSADTSSSWLI